MILCVLANRSCSLLLLASAVGAAEATLMLLRLLRELLFRFMRPSAAAAASSDVAKGDCYDYILSKMSLLSNDKVFTCGADSMLWDRIMAGGDEGARYSPGVGASSSPLLAAVTAAGCPDANSSLSYFCWHWNDYISVEMTLQSKVLTHVWERVALVHGVFVVQVADGVVGVARSHGLDVVVVGGPRSGHHLGPGHGGGDFCKRSYDYNMQIILLHCDVWLDLKNDYNILIIC